MKSTLLTILSAATFAFAGCAAQTSSAKIESDGAGAQLKRVGNMHQARFIEIFLAYREPTTGKLVAECYNTLFTSKGIGASRDTAPQDNVVALDFEKMGQKYGVLNASLNGPKLWTPDWSEVDAGVERDFNGIAAVWVAQLKMGDNTGGVEKTQPYVPVSIARKSSLGWNKGTKVALLDDAQGNTWIMKGFQLGLHPKQTYEEFFTAGSAALKKLPPGWAMRVITLEKDLVETPENGNATIMADEFFNVWDKTGPGMSNYKP